MNTIFIMFLLFLGILLITIGIMKNNNSVQCPTAQIIYRYIPRSFEEEQEEPVSVSDIFKSMFVNEDPWVKSTTSYDVRKTEEINKYFISQA